MAQNHDADLEALRSKVEERARSLVASLRKEPELLESKDVENLERLAKLLSSLETLDHRQLPGRRRAGLVLVLILSVILIFLLCVDRITDAEVFADLTLKEVSFELAESQPVLDLMELSHISASGKLSLELPRGFSAPPSLNQAGSFLLRAAPGGRITLEALSLNSGTSMTLASSRDEKELVLRMAKRPIELLLAVDGEVSLHATGHPPMPFRIDGPRPVHIRGSASHGSEMRLKPSKPSEIMLATPLQIRNLALYRVQQRGDRLGELARQESTILGGTIYLQDVGRTGITLRRQEPLTLRGAEGVVQSLSFENGKWHLEFRGYVQEMKTGFGKSRRNLLPTRAEWLQAQHSTWLFWSAAIYLVTLFYSLLRWLGIRL